MATAEIITIGDEILIGQITDTNSQWIAIKLNDIGVKVLKITSVQDDRGEILTALTSAKADIVLITGGLGPTKDDITKAVYSDFLNAPLVEDMETLANITTYFEQRGRPMKEVHSKQALVPEGCFVVKNECGTAPGMWFEKGNSIFLSMPGVPYEMKMMMENIVLPKLHAYFDLPPLLNETILTTGIGESSIAERIKSVEDALPEDVKLAYLPSLKGVRVRLSGTLAQKAVIDDAKRAIKSILATAVFGENEELLSQIVGKLLLERHKTISTAESCTGGYVGHLITSIPGSSAYYKGGVIAYSNDVKTDTLLVPEEIIEKYGAVSEETVRVMAQNVRKKLDSDVGLATSGIAGPGGGTDEKPVGTIWIACADGNKTVSLKLSLGALRENNIEMTAYRALELARQRLLDFN